ncbi:MAG: DUF1329 domain-containing protein [Pseudomonas sp.]
MLKGLFAAGLLVCLSNAMAAVGPQDVAKLGSSLTPLGGEQAGNAAGTIPAWSGGITQAPAGYAGPGHHHVDPFADDKPLFTITKSNLDQYRANLTAGQLALFAAYPDTFQIPVYPTRRSASAPQWVYDNTRANAASAHLLKDGNGFAEAFGGTPFPIPQSGVEALWNHVARYRGTYAVRQSSDASVQRNGSYALVTTRQEALFNYYQQGGSAAQLDNMLFYYMAVTKSPARLAGGALLVHETLDQVEQARQAWAYAAGQRRVRRAPNVAYDTPLTTADSLMTADDKDMFNGSPDRYDWQLLGKKEIYIPYNNYRISSPEVSYDQLIKPGHVNPQYTRYELHRVWVVEGKLKPGARHIYAKRTLYLDEDSWQAAAVDQYDSRGELWRVSLAYLKNYYELPTTWSALDVFHDLQSGRYYVQNLDNEERNTSDFSQPVPDSGYFSVATLRRLGTR